MHHLDVMLIPGEGLFGGQCDERTKLGHAGNSLLDNRADSYKKRTGNGTAAHPLPWFSAQQNRPPLTATCSSTVLLLYPISALCQERRVHRLCTLGLNSIDWTSRSDHVSHAV